MFPNLLKKNSLSIWNSENKIIFAKTLSSETEWLITSKPLINYFENIIGIKFYAKTLVDEINHVLEKDSKTINNVAHVSLGLIDSGDGYNSLTL